MYPPMVDTQMLSLFQIGKRMLKEEILQLMQFIQI